MTDPSSHPDGPSDADQRFSVDAPFGADVGLPPPPVAPAPSPVPESSPPSSSGRATGRNAVPARSGLLSVDPAAVASHGPGPGAGAHTPAPVSAPDASARVRSRATPTGIVEAVRGRRRAGGVSVGGHVVVAPGTAGQRPGGGRRRRGHRWALPSARRSRPGARRVRPHRIIHGAGHGAGTSARVQPAHRGRRPRHPGAPGQGRGLGRVDRDRRFRRHLRRGGVRRGHLRRRAGPDQRPRRRAGRRHPHPVLRRPGGPGQADRLAAQRGHRAGPGPGHVGVDPGRIGLERLSSGRRRGGGHRQRPRASAADRPSPAASCRPRTVGSRRRV